MIKVVTNSLGSGDWIAVKEDNNPSVMEGHRISAQDLVDILDYLGIEAKLIEVTDEELEEGNYL